MNLLYAHGGSENHGCEAIVRSLTGIASFTQDDVLMSEMPNEDIQYGVDKLLTVRDAKSTFSHGLLYDIRAKFSGDPDRFFYRQKYKSLADVSADIAFSIGGDNYCYPGMDKQMMIMHQLVLNHSKKSVLVGCSVEVDRLNDAIINDLRSYLCIWARESLTFDALQSKSFSNVVLMPDPAFTLKCKEVTLPEEFVSGNTVGINVSPMIIGYEKSQGMTLENYVRLIKYIIDNTEMQVALIPHVVWSHNDDREPLLALYEMFKETGRVVMVDEDAKLNAEEMKYIISKCRFLIAARTHASIAAYSTRVPTLVVGYSIKARGIARDIFGTEENYVVPVQSMTKPDELTNAFRWLMKHENDIIEYYQPFMPEYIGRIDIERVLR